MDEEVSDETLPDTAAGDETLPEEAVVDEALRKRDCGGRSTAKKRLRGTKHCRQNPGKKIRMIRTFDTRAIRHIYFTTTFIFAFLPLPVVTIIVALPAFWRSVYQSFY